MAEFQATNESERSRSNSDREEVGLSPKLEIPSSYKDPVSSGRTVPDVTAEPESKLSLKIHGAESYTSLGLKLPSVEIPPVSEDLQQEVAAQSEPSMLVLVDTGVKLSTILSTLDVSEPEKMRFGGREVKDLDLLAGARPKWEIVPLRLLSVGVDDSQETPTRVVRPLDRFTVSTNSSNVALETEQVKRVDRLPRKTLVTDQPIVVGNSLGDSEFMVVYVNPLDKEHFYVILAPRTALER